MAHVLRFERKLLKDLCSTSFLEWEQNQIILVLFLCRNMEQGEEWHKA